MIPNGCDLDISTNPLFKKNDTKLTAVFTGAHGLANGFDSVLDAAKILLNKSINQIAGKGIFKTVNKTVEEGSEKNTKIVNIIVEEKPTGEIFAGVGTGTAGTTFTAGIKENNYLGKGVKLDTNFSFGENKQTGIFSVRNPNYKNSDKESNFRIEVSEDDQLSNFGYKSNKEGLSAGLNYEQYKDVYFSPTLSLSLIHI